MGLLRRILTLSFFFFGLSKGLVLADGRLLLSRQSEEWPTFFAFLRDGLGGLAAAVALFEREAARALVGGLVAFGPGPFVVTTNCKPE